VIACPDSSRTNFFAHSDMKLYPRPYHVILCRTAAGLASETALLHKK